MGKDQEQEIKKRTQMTNEYLRTFKQIMIIIKRNPFVGLD